MPATMTMRAERIHAFGGPEVLRLEEIELPRPGPHELLVRVHAAGVNPVDWKIREGGYGQPELPWIMGRDFSGEIEALGPQVELFRAGQEVFGCASEKSGSYAEYALAPTSQVAEKPPGLDHIKAAALPIAALTAWQALFDKANLKSGQRVLIHAAAGGVGSFAVQFAKWKGAYVLGTASAQHTGLLRELGADAAIDYHATRFEEVARDIDVVLDPVGGSTQERSWEVLKPDGIMVSLVQAPSQQAAAAHHGRGLVMRCDPASRQELSRIAELVVSGRVRPIIANVLPLSQAAQAQELSQSGHIAGKLVLKVK